MAFIVMNHEKGVLFWTLHLHHIELIIQQFSRMPIDFLPMMLWMDLKSSIEYFITIHFITLFFWNILVLNILRLKASSSADFLDTTEVPRVFGFAPFSNKISTALTFPDNQKKIIIIIDWWLWIVDLFNRRWCHSWHC